MLREGREGKRVRGVLRGGREIVVWRGEEEKGSKRCVEGRKRREECVEGRKRKEER